MNIVWISNARRRAASVIFLALALVGVAATPGGAAGGQVLPPTAEPHGYSLTDMTKALALFTTSVNDPKYYPRTPFQILYVQQSDAPKADGRGTLFTGRGNFTVKSGTQFFVPLWNADDSPPVVGSFPKTPAGAKAYFFDPKQVGARDFQIIVDGTVTPIDSRYVAGPVTTPPLLDGGGTHMITLGAFLSPLTPGSHTVIIRGGIFGEPVQTIYCTAFLKEDETYTVNVVPGDDGSHAEG